MATPDKYNWLNQAVTETATVLRASVKFMAAAALEDGVGTVIKVDEHELDRPRIPKYGLVYAAVTYLRHEIVGQDDTAGQTDFAVDIGVHLESRQPATSRPADRVEMWQNLQKAASVIPALVSAEIGPEGGQFNGFCELANPINGSASEDEDKDGCYAMIETGIRLHVTLVD